MKIRTVFLVIAAAAMEASAYNVDEIVGAWTPADDADGKAALVVEHHAAWAKKDGAWHPLILDDSGPGEIGAKLIPLGKNPDRAFTIRLSEPNGQRALLSEWTRDHGGEKDRPLVRATMPDWDKVMGVDGLVGTWAETNVCAGAVSRFLLVRPGGTAVVVPQGANVDDASGLDSSVEFSWKRDCAGIRLAPNVSPMSKLLLLAKPCVMSLRPDGKSADIVCPPYFNGVVVRSAAKVSDPAERRRKMASDGTYHGMWVLDDLENGYSFYISPKGRGLLVSMKLGPEHILPFEWKAPSGGGKVHCTLMPRFSAGTQCWFSEFDFEYNPETNEVGLAIPPDGKDGEREPTRATLKFFNWNEMVDQVIKSLNEAKKQ